MSHNIPDVALSTLAAFIRSGISGLTVLEEWPNANQKLKYPSLTITHGQSKRMPSMPYELSKTAPSANQTTVNEVVATWDIPLQMDLWCSSKEQRSTQVEALLSLFNSQEMANAANPGASGPDVPDGLSLVMNANFSEYCRYEIDTNESVDDEAAAQRQERRERISVLANCREVRQRTYYAMANVEIHAQASVDPIVDDDTGTEVIAVQ